MELTRSQQILMDGLQTLKLNTEDIIMIMMCCQTEETARQMIEHILNLYDNKEEITMEKLLQKVVEMN